MRTRRQLRIEIPPDRNNDFVAALENALNSGWERDHEWEARSAACLQPWLLCYSCDARGEREAATIGIVTHEPGMLVISNVTPRNCLGELTDDQYNTVLGDFNETILQKIETDLPIRAVLTSNNVQPEALMPPEGLELLKKASESLAPPAQSAWYKFLIAINEREHRMTSELVETWFIEQNWNPGLAKGRAEEFDFASGLLEHVHQL